MRNDGRVHFIGSIPGVSTEDVFRRCCAAVGEFISTIPDGETGDRLQYVAQLAWNVYKDHPDIEILSRPHPVDPDDPNEWRSPDQDWLPRESDASDMWRFRARDGISNLHIDTLGYAAAAIDSYDVFKGLRSDGVIPEGIRFQVSLPSVTDGVGVFLASMEDLPVMAMGYEQAMARDIQRMLEHIPATDLAIQWDNVVSVIEHESALDLDKEAAAGQDRPAAIPPGSPTDRFKELFGRFQSLVPAEVGLGIHLCYGDIGHKHSVEPRDLGVSVHLANAAQEACTRSLDWVHMAVPISRNDEDYFSPLSDLSVDARLFLGLVHHTDGVEGTLSRISAARKYRSDFGVATECGFGRRPSSQLDSLLQIHAEVAASL